MQNKHSYHKLPILDGLELLDAKQHIVNFPFHTHNTFNITLVIEQVFYTKLSNRLLYATAGTIVITNPGEVHSTICDNRIGSSFFTSNEYLHIMNCIIVDDNKIARITMKQLASQVKDIVIVGECATAMDAYNLLQEQPADLIFLDIEMPGMTGLELTKNLGSKRPVIIFTTAKKEYAAEAFELNVADYIVKPVTPARFLLAIDKARDILASNSEEVKMNADEFIFIRDSNVIRRLKLEDILFAEAMGDYVKLHTLQKFFAIHTTLKTIEERLPSPKFFRIHRSYIVAINKIDTIQEGVIIVNGKPLPVADAYRASLNKQLNIL